MLKRAFNECIDYLFDSDNIDNTIDEKIDAEIEDYPDLDVDELRDLLSKASTKLMDMNEFQLKMFIKTYNVDKSEEESKEKLITQCCGNCQSLDVFDDFGNGACEVAQANKEPQDSCDQWKINPLLVTYECQNCGDVFKEHNANNDVACDGYIACPNCDCTDIVSGTKEVSEFYKKK
jgi:hypothetical protein